MEELLRSLPPQLLGGPSSPSRTPSSRDSDPHDGPEEGGEEEASRVLQVCGGWVEGGLRGSRAGGSRTEFWLIRSLWFSGVLPGRGHLALVEGWIVKNLGLGQVAF